MGKDSSSSSSSSDNDNKYKEEKNLFGRIDQDNVMFLLDTSGSMFEHFGFVKAHLRRLLQTKRLDSVKFNFNIIEYSDTVSKWAKEIKPCTKKHTKSAWKWLQSIACRTSTNLLVALEEAFKDRRIKSVHIVTDGMPDQRADIILQRCQEDSKGRQVNIVYIKNSNKGDSEALELYENIARLTRGTLHTAALGRSGEVLSFDRLYPRDRYNGHDGYSDERRGRSNRDYHDNRAVTFQRKDHQEVKKDKYVYQENLTYEDDRERFDRRNRHNGYFSDEEIPFKHQRNPYNSVVASGYNDYDYQNRSYDNFTLSKVSPLARNLMSGLKVLAKSQRDGLYHIGTIREIDNSDRVLVDFEPTLSQSFNGGLQEVLLENVISYGDAIRHNICVGDYVLVNADSRGSFYPGIVTDGFDRRDFEFEDLTPNLDRYLTISLSNDDVIQTEASNAVWIPMSFYHKIKDSVIYKNRRSRSSRSLNRSYDDDVYRDRLNRGLNRSFSGDIYRDKWVSDKLNGMSIEKPFLKNGYNEDERNRRSLSVPSRYRRTAASSSDSEKQFAIIPHSSTRPRKSKTKTRLLNGRLSDEKRKSKIGIDREGAMVQWKNRYEKQTRRLDYDKITQAARKRSKSSDPRGRFHNTYQQGFNDQMAANENGYTMNGNVNYYDSGRQDLNRSANYEVLQGRHIYNESDSPKRVQFKREIGVDAGGLPRRIHGREIDVRGSDPYIPSPPDYNWSPETATRQPLYQATDIITNRPRPNRPSDSITAIQEEARRQRREMNRKQINYQRENGMRQAWSQREMENGYKESQRREAKEHRLYDNYHRQAIADERQRRVDEHKQRIHENITAFEEDREAYNQDKKQQRIKTMKIKKEMQIEYHKDKKSKDNADENIRQSIKQAIRAGDADDYTRRLENEVEMQERQLDRMRRANERQRHLEYNRTNNAFKDEQLRSYVDDNQRQNFRASLLP